MGKAVGGFFRLLGFLLVLGLVGYNTFETARLRAEVAELKRGRETRPAPSASKPKPAAPSEDAVELLAESRRHAEQAQALMKQRRFADAQREITLAADAARRAGADARGDTEDALAQLRSAARTLSDLSEKAGRLAGGTAGRQPSDGPDTGSENERR